MSLQRIRMYIHIQGGPKSKPLSRIIFQLY